MTIMSERDLRQKIRAELPSEAFKSKPYRALLILPLVSVILIASVFLIRYPQPWYYALPISLLIGNFYGSLMFLGHEIGHGATVRSVRLQNFLLYITGCAFCLSPSLWRIWHNQTHHGYTNIPGRDPDIFGTLDEFNKQPLAEKLICKFAPGSGHWLSIFYLFCFFTLHAQWTLWRHSNKLTKSNQFSRRYAALESIFMVIFWALVGWLIGLKCTFFVILLPMFTANFVLLSYILTNHLLRPLTNAQDTLSTTMSVTTYRFLDWIHFNFSHHVEHHLFPSMSSVYYPLVRESIRRHVGNQYLSPPHFWAISKIFQTPKIYDGYKTLIEPFSGRRVSIVDLETLIQEALN